MRNWLRMSVVVVALAAVNARAQTNAQALQPTATAAATGGLNGTVTDTNDDAVPGASVTLEEQSSQRQFKTTANGEGFFDFEEVPVGVYKLTVTAADFGGRTRADVAVKAGVDDDLPDIELKVATVSTTVDAVTLHEIAVQQVKVEEKQRVLGIVPNFYVSYAKNPVPLSSGLKFHLAVRSLWDPVTIAGSAAIAGYQYEENIFSGYGDGEAGYWKRFGASMGDNLTDTMISGAILPVVLHQDPRYFYKGTGSVKSRAWYAISFVWRCKGDNGRWEVNYSGLLGGLASGAISNAYYPPANRGVQLTIDNWAIGSGFGAVGGLVQEFVMKHLTPGANKMQ